MLSGMMGVKKGTTGKRGDCTGESSERGETLWVEITNEKRTCKARECSQEKEPLVPGS